MPGYGARDEKDGAGAGRKRKKLGTLLFGQSGTFQQGQGKDQVLFLPSCAVIFGRRLGTP